MRRSSHAAKLTQRPDTKQKIPDKWFKEVGRMENEIILYTDENGKTNVSVRFADEDVWVTQNQLTRNSC